MTDLLKVGVVGVGNLGQWHARIYSELDDAELVGVHDADDKRAQRIARKYRTTAFRDVSALADKVDALSIATPADTHFSVAMPLLENGTHLLVEKPIASTTDDAEAMVKAAEKNGLILQVGHVERFNPVMKYLEDILVRPRFIEAVRLSPYPFTRKGRHARGTDVSVVLDLMIHDLDIILHLVGSDVREIHAIGVPVLSASEDIANVRLCFVNGCVANLTASRISRDQLRKIRVFQENAYLSLDYRNQAGQIYRKTDSRIIARKVPIEKGEPLANELAGFVHCVRSRNEPVVSGRHASAALKLAVDICEHIRRGGS
jgi:predicted dehydrogenase